MTSPMAIIGLNLYSDSIYEEKYLKTVNRSPIDTNYKVGRQFCIVLVGLKTPVVQYSAVKLLPGQFNLCLTWADKIFIM